MTHMGHGQLNSKFINADIKTAQVISVKQAEFIFGLSGLRTKVGLVDGLFTSYWVLVEVVVLITDTCPFRLFLSP